MTNTSATGGPLAPASVSPPLEDVDLDVVFQSLVTGIVGLDGMLVRPRWQPTLPKEPEVAVNWCAIGVTNIDAEQLTPAVVHGLANDGSNPDVGADYLYQQEKIAVLASFYGPAAHTNATLLRDGLMVAQNRELLLAQQMSFVQSDRVTSLPELINQSWRKRVDLPLTFRRLVTRVYPVENIISATGTFYEDKGQIAGAEVTAQEPWSVPRPSQN